MRLHIRTFLMPAITGGAAGVGIGLTLWAHAALAAGGTPPAPVQLCAKAGGAVIYAASGTCPSNTTAIAPVAQQSGVADLYTRLNTDEATIAGLQSQATTAANNITTLQGQVASLQGQAITAASSIAGLQSQVASMQIQVTTDTNTVNSMQSTVTSLQNQVTTGTNNITSLQGLLKGVSRAADVNNYDTLTFSGMNLQVVNGTGSESTLNGLGNLIIGYNDNLDIFGQPLGFARTGSHNLITGDNNGWTSYGGLVAGQQNQIQAQYASVSGGYGNKASGESASVSGGGGNSATSLGASVSGGSSSAASGEDASVSGGVSGTASGVGASVSGGAGSTASGDYASVSGGRQNTAGGSEDAILGGTGIDITSSYICAYFPGNPTSTTC